MRFNLLMALPLLVQSAIAAPVAAAAVGKKNMVYYAGWDIYSGFRVPQLNAPYLTHVIYAFLDIDTDDGSVISRDPNADYEGAQAGDNPNEPGNNAYGNVKQLYLLKKQNRKLKTLLSIGGFAISQEGKFDAIAGNATKRKRFAQTAVKLMADWGMDGIDIDWEYPTWNADGEKFYQLLKDTRAEMDAYAAGLGQSYRYQLTVATSAGSDKYSKLPLSKMNNILDSIHLMSYDYAGSWDSTAGHQAALYPDTSNPLATKVNTNQAVNDYLAKGVSPSKLLMGLPLYGRSFANAKGLGKTYSGTGAGDVEKGVWLFKNLPRAGSTVKVDNALGTTVTWDAKTKEIVTLDGSGSAKVKSKYIKTKNLGGAFFWEAMGDKSGSSSLITVVGKDFGTLDQTQNQLSYPNSVYDNIRKGMP